MRNYLLTACLVVLSFTANAAIVSVDWKTPGDNLITRDTDAGLEWLDLTVTVNRSYNDVSSQLGVGSEFEGFRYATRLELYELWNSFGGNGSYGWWSTFNNGVFDAMAPFVGDLYTDYVNSNHGLNWTAGDGGSFWITQYDPNDTREYRLSRAYDNKNDSHSATSDYFNIYVTSWTLDDTGVEVGSALIRDTTVVPIPATIWLFGSGLIGLIGIVRRRKHND